MRQYIMPIFILSARVAPQKRGDSELQTRAKLLPLVFAAAQIKIERLNRNMVETKVGPIQPTAKRKESVADQLDKLQLALGVIFVVTRPLETRAGLLPLFRKQLLIKRVEPFAFEFRGDVSDCIVQRVTRGFPAQIRYGFVESPAEIAAATAEADSPLLIFFN